MDRQDVRRPKGRENEDPVGAESRQDFIPSDMVGLPVVRSYHSY